MDLVQRIIEDKIKRYSIFSLTIAVITAIILTSIFRYLFKLIIPKPLIDQSPNSFHGLLLFIAFSVLLFYILKFWNDFFGPAIVTRAYVWTKSVFNKNKIIGIPPISKWIFQGSLRVNQVLEITSSNSGSLLKHSLYKNFSMTFHLKLNNGTEERNALGIIFHAQDLDNYFMLQLRTDNRNRITIVPHVRFLGDWDVLNDIPTKLFFDKRNGEIIYLKVENYQVLIRIRDYEFNWYLPTHVDVNLTQRPHNNTKQSTDDSNSSKKIWFRGRYGKIGFRAQGKLERAEIDQLIAEEL